MLKGIQRQTPMRLPVCILLLDQKAVVLAMVIDIFSSLLSGMPWGPHVNAMYGDLGNPRKLGHFIMAMDVNRFVPLEIFKQHLSEMLEEFGDLPPADGFNPGLLSWAS